MITTKIIDNYVLLIEDGKALLAVKKDNVLIFDDSVTSIGPSFMESDPTIEGVIFSDTIEELDDNAFLHCSNLKFVVLGKKLKLISQCAFTDNKSLRYVLYNGTRKEYLEILQGEPFETVGKIHCTDGIVWTVNAKD